jgi:hypothetical protein
MLTLATLVSTGCLVTAGPAHHGGGPPPPVENGPAPTEAVISGVVVDGATRAGLDKVALDFGINGKLYRTVTTDGSGHYETPPFPPGEYAVRIRREKYLMIEKDHLMMRAGQNDMNFEMTRRER